MKVKKNAVIAIVVFASFLVVAGAVFSVIKIRSYMEEKKIIRDFEGEVENENRTVVKYLKGTKESFIEYALLFDDPVDGCGVRIKTRVGIGTLALTSQINEWRKIKRDEKIALNEKGDGVCFTIWQTASNILEDYEIIATELNGGPHFIVNGDTRK